LTSDEVTRPSGYALGLSGACG